MPTARAKLQHSSDGGTTFSRVDPIDVVIIVRQNEIVDYGGVRVRRDNDDVLYWFGYYSVYEAVGGINYYYHLRRSLNTGVTWASMEPGLGLANADIVTTLRINPDNPQNIVLFVRRAVGNDDLWRSINGCLPGGYTELDDAMDFELSDLERDQDNPADVFYIGNRNVAATLVERTLNEAAGWQDKTGNLDGDTGDRVTRIIKLRRV